MARGHGSRQTLGKWKQRKTEKNHEEFSESRRIQKNLEEWPEWRDVQTWGQPASAVALPGRESSGVQRLWNHRSCWETSLSQLAWHAAVCRKEWDSIAYHSIVAASCVMKLKSHSSISWEENQKKPWTIYENVLLVTSWCWSWLSWPVVVYLRSLPALAGQCTADGRRSWEAPARLRRSSLGGAKDRLGMSLIVCTSASPNPKTSQNNLVPFGSQFPIFPHDFEHVWRLAILRTSEDHWIQHFGSWRWQMWQAAAVLLLARDGSKAQEAVQLMAASKAADPEKLRWFSHSLL